MNYLNTVDLDEELTKLEAELAPLAPREADRLAALRELRYEVGPDWECGEILIPAGLWAEYTEELAYDIGAVDRYAAWPGCYIDWEAAAESLRQDYAEAKFDGVTYYFLAS